ncbi:hypothetical protein CLOM_g24022 [Closterium sp. NIES-68]|nr:hypothetical protein CLOM_g24022 [Closterium sp. NIES-68]GJP80967.1 hypothetical protein CLOP_g11158 [Closterium sp. NIES-67]
MAKSTLAFALAAVLGVAFLAGSALGAATVPNGKPCYLTSAYKPVKPCAGGPATCVVKNIPPSGARDTRISGICNSTYYNGPYCAFASQPYAVGTSNIPGNPNCPRCTCTLQKGGSTTTTTTAAGATKRVFAQTASSSRKPAGSIKAKSTATCVCNSGATVSGIGGGGTPCKIGLDGKLVAGSSCPVTQSSCFINKVGINGADSGECTAPQSISPMACSSAGETWGMRYYAVGTIDIPEPGNWCSRCKCGPSGLTECKPKSPCTPPK